MKTLTQENFDQIKSGSHACPYNMTFVVGKVYKFKNPSNSEEVIEARCTQNCPYALLKV